MPIELNKYGVILLALLQTLSPLAHAHAGKYEPHQGLHIPGLESFHYRQDAPFLDNVNKDRETEGLLVMVETGIKNPQTVIPVQSDNNFAGLTDIPIPSRLLPEYDQNFSPHPDFALCGNLLSSSNSPRAPPVL